MFSTEEPSCTQVDSFENLVLRLQILKQDNNGAWIRSVVVVVVVKATDRISVLPFHLSSNDPPKVCFGMHLSHEFIPDRAGAFIIRNISGPPVTIKRRTSSAANNRKLMFNHVV